MFELKVITHFAAAHQLRMVAKKCESLHGHNWRVEVCVGGEHLEGEAGILMDFGVLKKYVAEVMDTLDHKFLNEVAPFCETYPPSSENIARYIARSLEDRLSGTPVRVSRVSAWESENACATYIP